MGKMRVTANHVFFFNFEFPLSNEFYKEYRENIGDKRNLEM